MRFEDLKRVWREEGPGEYKRVKIEDLSAAQGRAGNHLNRMVRLGLRSIGTIMLISIPLLVRAAIKAPWPLLAWSGAALGWGWLGYLFVSWWKLGRAKPDPGLPVRDAVDAELERLRMLERFREGLPWSMPAFVVGQIVFHIGMTADLRESLGRVLIFSAMVLLITALGFRGNWRRLERVVRPLREELEGWARDLEEFEVEGGGGIRN